MRLLGFILICLLLPTSAFCQFGSHRQDTKIKSITFENPYLYTFYVHNQNTTYISASHGSEFTWSEIFYDSTGKAVKEKLTVKEIITDMELNNSEPLWSDTGIIESVSYYFYNEIDSCIKIETYCKNQLESVLFYEYDSVLLVNKVSSFNAADSRYTEISRINDSISYKGKTFFKDYESIYGYDSLGRIVKEENCISSSWPSFKTYFYENNLLTKIVYDNNRPLRFSSDGWKHNFENHYTYDSNNKLISIQTYSYLIKMGVKSNEKWTEKKQRQPIYEYYDDKNPDRINIINPSASPARDSKN